jgi:hypothetical protein
MIDGAGATSLAATRVGSLVGPASKLPRVMPATNAISIVTMITPARGGVRAVASPKVPGRVGYSFAQSPATEKCLIIKPARMRDAPNSGPFLAVAPHSNQSLLGAVSVARKRNFEARDKGAEMAVGILLAARRDQAPARKPAGSGLFAKSREISVRVRLRGGVGRTRTT